MCCRWDYVRDSALTVASLFWTNTELTLSPFFLSWYYWFLAGELNKLIVLVERRIRFFVTPYWISYWKKLQAQMCRIVKKILSNGTLLAYNRIIFLTLSQRRLFVLFTLAEIQTSKSVLTTHLKRTTTNYMFSNINADNIIRKLLASCCKKWTNIKQIKIQGPVLIELVYRILC